jgi:DNA-binding NarL/FixJ family response regulator
MGSGKAINKSVVRREWFGLFTLTTWYFATYQSYDPTLFTHEMNMFWFSLALGIPLILLGIIFSSNIDAVSRIAKVTAPIGLACNLIMPLLPEPGFVALFLLSAPLIAPLILRCCYGVVMAAKPNKKLQTFMSAITLAIFVHAGWLLAVQGLSLPPFIHFLFPVLMGAASCLITRRRPPEYIAPVYARSFLPTKYFVFVLFVFLVVFVFDLSSDLFHAYFLVEGLANNAWIFVCTVFLPAASLTLYAWLADRHREKTAIIIGLSLYLLGLVFALLPDASYFLNPLILADGIGGAYADFFVVGFSILFFTETKKPVLMASLGMAVDIITASFLWTVEKWIPAEFLDAPLAAPHIVVMAALTILLLVLALFAFDRRTEKTFAASVLGLLTEAKNAEAAGAGSELSPVEQQIAVLLFDGYTHGEIARKLRLPSAETTAHLRSIRDKLTGRQEIVPEAVIGQIADEYRLTRRERQMLLGIVSGKTNAEIAAEMVLSENTIKTHMRGLFSKLPAKNRTAARDWVTSQLPDDKKEGG